jgi:O-antigen/teichoic acid export membrane protein
LYEILFNVEPFLRRKLAYMNYKPTKSRQHTTEATERHAQKHTEKLSNLTRKQEKTGENTMDEASELGKVSATGGFHLFWGKVLSTIIMAVGTLVLGNLMLESEYGLYAVALIPPLTINLLQDWGMSAAMTKYIAQRRAKHQEETMHSVITAGLMFKSITGLALSLSSLILANYIATVIFNRPETTVLIAIASLTILADSLLTASQASFNGFEKMELNSFTLITHSAIKITASSLLVLFGYGALGAVLGHTFSLLAAGIIGVVMLHFFLFKKLPRKRISRQVNTLGVLREMLRFGVPLSISTIISGFLVQFYAFMMAFYCSNVMIGNYQIAVNFSVLLTFFTFPIVAVLLPTFSKLDPENDPQLLQTVFSSSVKYTSMLLVPATIATMVLSRPMIGTLFGQKWTHAPVFLTLYITSNLLVLLGSLILGTLLTGTGETKTLLKLALIKLALGIPLAFILIPIFGIAGVILGPITASIPSLIWGLHWIWEKYTAKADYKSSAKIFAASTLAAIITYLALSFINTIEWIQLAIGGTVFLTAYILVAPIIGAITPTDINNLRTMLSGLGIISKLVNIPLTVAEKATENLAHR